MRKNGLGRLEANAVARGLRAWAGRWYRPRPLVPTTAFQDRTEPYPGHWRTSPEEWSTPVPRERLDQALATLPDAWREVLLRPDAASTQQRDVLALARAALRDALDALDSPPPREPG